MARPSKQQEIGIWLKGLLSAGRRKAADVIAAAVAAGYATNPGDGTRTLRRVKTELGIVSEQEGEVWYWRNPAVEQAKPASEDKLDILTHKVDEAIRLSKPAVQVAVESDSTGWLTSKKWKAYDPNDPKNKAIAEQSARVQQRFEAVQGIVTSTDPFKLLDSANLEEIEQMLLLVHNHHSDLETRSKGEPRYKQVTGREWNRKKEAWVDVPAVQIEETKYISDVPVDGAKSIRVQDGFEPGEDVTFEMGKWDTWIDRAHERTKQLAKEQRNGVLAT
jgi:hypothetical protein